MLKTIRKLRDKDSGSASSKSGMLHDIKNALQNIIIVVCSIRGKFYTQLHTVLFYGQVPMTVSEMYRVIQNKLSQHKVAVLV